MKQYQADFSAQQKIKRAFVLPHLCPVRSFDLKSRSQIGNYIKKKNYGLVNFFPNILIGRTRDLTKQTFLWPTTVSGGRPKLF